MPRNVRNFWIEGRADGRASGFSAGPRSRDGGFFARVYVRAAGGVADAFGIRGYAAGDRLRVEVSGPDGRALATLASDRDAEGAPRLIFGGDAATLSLEVERLRSKLEDVASAAERAHRTRAGRVEALGVFRAIEKTAREAIGERSKLEEKGA